MTTRLSVFADFVFLHLNIQFLSFPLPPSLDIEVMSVFTSRAITSLIILLTLQEAYFSELTVSNSQLSSSQTPEIRKFSPTKCPTTGNTQITIYGSGFQNLVSVKVAGEDCNVKCFEDNKITCNTYPTGEKSGPVQVTVNNEGQSYTETSVDSLFFVRPQINSLKPREGHRCRDTNVTIQGKNLDCGLSRKISFGTTPCVELSVDSLQLTCLIKGRPFSDIDKDTPQSLTLKYEGIPQASNLSFVFLPEPSVSSISPLGAIKSGWNKVHVSGHHFPGVTTEPRWRVDFPPNNSIHVFNPCVVLNNTLMECFTPPSPTSIPPGIAVNTTIRVFFGEDLIHQNEVINLTYHPDPTLFNFHGTMKVDPSSPFITINGTDINSDYFIDIQVGNESQCLIFEANSTYLKCKIQFLSDQNRPSLGETREVFYFITDKVKGHLGTVIFTNWFYDIEKYLNIHKQVAAAVGALLILFAFCIVFIFYRHYRNKNNRTDGVDNQNDQISTDSGVETNFTNESRIAFRLLNRGYGTVQRTLRHFFSKNEDYEPLLDVFQQRDKFGNDLICDLIKEGKVIRRDHLHLDTKLGEGHFGSVYQASLRDSSGNGTIVAVKTLHEGFISNRDINMFVREAIMMKDFNHANVLGLIGLTFDVSIPLVVLPFMNNGSLLDYLRNENLVVKVKDLISFSIQVAKGMEYLANQKFVVSFDINHPFSRTNYHSTF